MGNGATGAAALPRRAHHRSGRRPWPARTGHDPARRFVTVCSGGRQETAGVEQQTAPGARSGLAAAIGRIAFVECPLEAVDILETDVVVSSHACGALTDVVLARAAAAHARVAVLPCCHDLANGNDGGLSGWVDGAVAIDITRAHQLRERGYRIWTQTISGDITPKNRLLLGAPRRH